MPSLISGRTPESESSKIELLKRLNIRNFSKIAESDIENEFISILGSALIGDNLPRYFNLRSFYYMEWLNSTLAFYRLNRSNVSTLKLLSKHYQRDAFFSISNEFIEKYFEYGGNPTSDIGREFIRNKFMSMDIKNISLETDLLESRRVESIYKNAVSLSSYSIQKAFLSKNGNIDSLKNKISHFQATIQKEVNNISHQCEDYKSLISTFNNINLRIVIVGKGETLKGKKNGKNIDANDFIVRVNHLPKNDDFDDYGSKTDLLIYGDHLEGKFKDIEVKKLKISPYDKYNIEKNNLYPEGSVSLSYIVESITYRRATTGLRCLVSLAILLNIKNLTAYGFDFYNYNREGITDNNIRSRAGMAHEIDYESWFSKNVLTKVSNIKFQ